MAIHFLKKASRTPGVVCVFSGVEPCRTFSPRWQEGHPGDPGARVEHYLDGIVARLRPRPSAPQGETQ